MSPKQSEQLKQKIEQRKVLVYPALSSGFAGHQIFFLFSLSQMDDMIKEVPEIYPIPFSPPFVEGIAQWREHVIPVISLEKCLGLETIVEPQRLIVVRGATDDASLSEVRRVMIRTSSSIRMVTLPIPSTPSPFVDWIPKPSMVRAVYEWEHGFLIIADINRIIQGNA